MSGVEDLARWLGEQLDAEEAEARLTADAFGVAWTTDDAMESVSSDTGADVVAEPYAPRSFIAAHDPARVLREIGAKRKLLALHSAVWIDTGDADGNDRSGYFCVECDSQTFPCRTLRLLALPYADREGYLESWRP